MTGSGDYNKAPDAQVNAAELSRKNPLHVTMSTGNYVTVNFGKVWKPVLVDSGASVSMVSMDLINLLNLSERVDKRIVNTAKLVDGSCINIQGRISLNFSISGQQFTMEFKILNSMGYWAILGRDFLKTYTCQIDYLTDNLVIFGPNNKPQNLIVPMAIGVFEQYEECDPSWEAHDITYYKKAAIPNFSGTEMSYEKDGDTLVIKNKKNNSLLPVPLDLTNSIFSEPQKQKLRNLIKKYRDVFAVNDSELGRTNVYRHKLRLKPGAQPPKPKLYRTNPTDRLIIKKHIEDMLENDIIKPVSEGSFSSPTLLVPKKDGGLRYCADLRDMNRILEEDTYPLPLIQEVLDAIGHAQATIYSVVDLRSAFWQISMHPASQKYLTINTHLGRFAFKVLPFGLHSSPAAFQKLMNTILRGIMWDFAIPFLDDVAIFSKDYETHLVHIEEVFKRLKAAGLKLKPQKCQFGVNHINYLGHKIGKKGIAPFPDKVQAVKDFATPTNVTQVRQFLGLGGY